MILKRRVTWSDLCIKWITLAGKLKIGGRRQGQKQEQEAVVKILMRDAGGLD